MSVENRNPLAISTSSAAIENTSPRVTGSWDLRTEHSGDVKALPFLTNSSQYDRHNSLQTFLHCFLTSSTQFCFLPFPWQVLFYIKHLAPKLHLRVYLQWTQLVKISFYIYSSSFYSLTKCNNLYLCFQCNHLYQGSNGLIATPMFNFQFHLLGFLAAFNVVDHLLLKTLYSSGGPSTTYFGSTFCLCVQNSLFFLPCPFKY